jgi:uncharacterized protein with FMN-binding domain
MKKPVIITIVAVGILALIGTVLTVSFNIKFKKMTEQVDADYAAVQMVDLKSVKDGVYKGSYQAFIVAVDLEVEVVDHEITRIEVKDQKCGKGYEGLEVIDRIVNAQSLDVDAKTGATGSSSVIVIAVDRALKPAIQSGLLD